MIHKISMLIEEYNKVKIYSILIPIFEGTECQIIYSASLLVRHYFNDVI